MEIRCDDQIIRNDENLQVKYTKEAIDWLFHYLNFTDIISERTESSPWSWYGAMFYAGQLYTTIGELYCQNLAFAPHFSKYIYSLLQEKNLYYSKISIETEIELTFFPLYALFT